MRAGRVKRKVEKMRKKRKEEIESRVKMKSYSSEESANIVDKADEKKYNSGINLDDEPHSISLKKVKPKTSSSEEAAQDSNNNIETTNSTISNIISETFKDDNDPVLKIIYKETNEKIQGIKKRYNYH
jgi:hypothetical protein